MIAKNPMAVGDHIVLTVIKVPAHTVLTVHMVMEQRKVTRSMEMIGAGVEPRGKTRTAKRRRAERVSTALARLTLVENVWDVILVLPVPVTPFIMKNFVIFAKVMVKSFITLRTSVGLQRADTLHRAP